MFRKNPGSTQALTVEENLELAARSAPQRVPLAEILATFPRLHDRRISYGRSLSGGEQQMLAIARALIRRLRLMLLDDPFEGLAVTIVQNLLEICRELDDALLRSPRNIGV